MDNQVDAGSVDKFAVIAAIIIMVAIILAGVLGIPLS